MIITRLAVMDPTAAQPHVISLMTRECQRSAENAHRDWWAWWGCGPGGAPGARTLNRRIKSPLLCH